MIGYLVVKWLQNFLFFAKVFDFGVGVVSFISVKLKSYP